MKYLFFLFVTFTLSSLSLTAHAQYMEGTAEGDDYPRDLYVSCGDDSVVPNHPTFSLEYSDMSGMTRGIYVDYRFYLPQPDGKIKINSPGCAVEKVEYERGVLKIIGNIDSCVVKIRKAHFSKDYIVQGKNLPTMRHCKIRGTSLKEVAERASDMQNSVKHIKNMPPVSFDE